MRFVTLVSWLLTASLGAFMLRTWLVRGGLRRERARAGGLPPQLIFGHAGLAIAGLLVWTAFTATGSRALAWTAVGMLMVTVGLGLCTVTLWTPYPARKPGERRVPAPWDEPAVVVPDTPAGAADASGVPDPAGAAGEADPLDTVITDEMIAALIDDSYSAGRRRRPVSVNPAVLVPVAHGFAAIGTFVLAVTTASM